MTVSSSAPTPMTWDLTLLLRFLDEYKICSYYENEYGYEEFILDYKKIARTNIHPDYPKYDVDKLTVRIYDISIDCTFYYISRDKKNTDRNIYTVMLSDFVMSDFLKFILKGQFEKVA